jgi:transcriptional regulator of heat shock response
MELSTRQENILKAVIHEYVRTAEPVGSKELVSQYNFGVSPATVRAEMHSLERGGLLRQPHTSAGRVPTDVGYRHFVRSISQGTIAPRNREDILRRRMVRVRKSYELLAREIAEMLAELSEQAAITYTGQNSERVGLSNLMRLPELRDEELAKAIATIFDNPESLMQRVKANRPQHSGTEVTVQGGAPVKVLIGSETGMGQVAMSMLVSSFEVSPGKQGHLIILGPSRMAYERNVSLLSYVSQLLSRHGMTVLAAVALPTALVISTIKEINL